MTEFWAKTTKEKKPGISVENHMMNVGTVANQMLALLPEGLHISDLPVNCLSALAALHDIGKISPGFQRKCPEWLVQNKLVTIDKNFNWASLPFRHGEMTQKHLASLFKQNNIPPSKAKYLATVLGAHHGKIPIDPLRLQASTASIDENESGILWKQERDIACSNILNAFQTYPSNLIIDKDDPSLWWLAGLTSVADWIGSDERFFPVDPENKESDRKERAIEALHTIGWSPPTYNTGLTFHDIFGFSPNDLQKETASLVKPGSVCVVEAPMGIGKTEAALWAAYRLFEKGEATGLYFALPTQATSNRLHKRLTAFVQKITNDTHQTKLIHGSSWLLANETAFPKSSQDRDNGGRDWFASSKRALLSPFGIGTIDQALLSIVAAKHFFVRRFALAGKVVILDEVHSYDAYTGCLIEELVSLLLSLKCTVIVLSATLTKTQRNRLLQTSIPELSPSEIEPFPLVSQMSPVTGITRKASAPPPPREVFMCFQDNTEAMERALNAANNGASVLWIANTVAQAQETFDQICTQTGDHIKTGLLHSRFPYWRRTALEEEWMSRLDKSGATREPSILVSTQIVEQSVDIDADIIISELAPIDMLLQRMGRLWRHKRETRPLPQANFILLNERVPFAQLKTLSPEKIKEAFGAKAWVYEPYVLLRTLESLQPYRCAPLHLPDDIRSLLESVYAEAPETESSGWSFLENDMQGRISAQRGHALNNSNIWNVPLSDEEGVQTRLNERETASLILCHKEGTTLQFLDGQVFQVAQNYSLSLAKAIHSNLVKIPATYLIPKATDKQLDAYVRGRSCVGTVAADGQISCPAFLETTHAVWRDDTGVVIKNTEKRSK